MRQQAVIPLYQVEYISVERRLLQRRNPDVQSSRHLSKDLELAYGRRNDDILTAQHNTWKILA